MTAESPGAEAQRVRACLECGELVPYEERSCAHCGYHEPLMTAAAAKTSEPCPECGRDVPTGLIFCPKCGADRGPDPGPLVSSAALPSQASTKVVDGGALVLTLLGPLLMAAAVLAAFAYD